METSKKRLSRWGIGPMIGIPGVALSLVTWAAASEWPGIFLIPRPGAVRIAGAVLTALGLMLWIAGVVTVMRAYNRDELVTTGVFSLVRHPVYAGWISLAFPGLALFTGAWLFLVIDLLAFGVFRSQIHVEDEYLEARFGKAYIEYRGRVNALIPIPRVGKR